METENLSTLKINVLRSQEQFDNALDNEKVNNDELYLVPDEEIDLSDYATKNDIENKVNKAGDTMTGNLVIRNESTPTVEVLTTEQGKGQLHKNANANVDYGTQIIDMDSSGNDAILKVRGSQWNSPQNALQLTVRNADRSTVNNYTVYHTGNKPTAEDIGAVKKIGDTMAGNLTIQTNEWPSFYLRSVNGYTALYKNANSTNNNGTQLVDTNVDNSLQSRIVLNTLADLNKKIQLVTRKTVDGQSTDTSYSILHTGNKGLITPADIGAASTSVVTTSANGLMSKEDKTKLDGITTPRIFTATAEIPVLGADAYSYIDVNGLLSTDIPIISLNTTKIDNLSVELYRKEFAKIVQIEVNQDNQIVARTGTKATTKKIPIYIKVVQ